VTAAAQLVGSAEPITVVLFLRTTVTEIDSDGVLDLRIPQGQGELISILQSSNFLRGKFSNLGPDSFLQCVPTLMAEQRGGTIFHVYIGHMLRKRGVRGLIYPSARCDAATEVVNGALARWAGWCFVDYGGAPEVATTLFDSFEDYLEKLWNPATFSEGVRILRSTDEAFSGSFSVVGLEDDRWNLISAIAATAREHVIELVGQDGRPVSFSQEQSESLSRELRELAARRWHR
jgi:hypothetical protein